MLLIENNESQKAAAALAVNVGHFSDPKDRQGMAHFLEHMLFLGTKNFPDGSEYQQFVSKNGGNHNAWTATEHTCFFLDIFHQSFEQALERFSDFFINPLFAQEFIEKERQNIDAEFKLKLKDDIRRLYDVHKETINQAHPFSKFSVGNVDTLADRENENVRDTLVAFYQQYYFAQNMTVALEGPFSLDKLAEFAETYFSPIVSQSEPIKPIDVPIYLPEHQQIKIDVCPVKDDRQLIISFALPCIDDYYRDKPDSLIAYLIGHEGPGSLLSYLKQQRWAMRLSAGSGIHGSNFKDFNISIAMTELGEQHVKDIVGACFSYLNLLKTSALNHKYFEEKKAIALLSFDFQEQMKPIESVSHLVMNMQYFPSEYYIYGDYMMEQLNQADIDKFLSLMSPDNMRLLHISKNNTYDQTSFWYQVPYKTTALSQDWLVAWHQPENIAALHLPAENPYIVSKPEIVVKEKPQTQPEVICQTAGMRAWFKQDQSFNIPKGYIYLNIDSPRCVQTNENIAMTRLFINLFTDNITEEHYAAELAGMHYHLYPHQSGMTMQISGLSEKQPELLTQLINSLFNQVFCPHKFALFQKQLIKHIKNTQDSKPISQLFAQLNSVLQPNKLDNNLFVEMLEKITFEDFQQFYQSLFAQVYLELFIHGNWLKQDADHMIKIVSDGFDGLLSDDASIDVPVVDTKNEGTLSHVSLLKEHDYAALTYFTFADKNIETLAFAMVVSQLLSPHFFEQMRTEKQYGYLVGVGYVPTGYYPGIALYIQSPHTEAQELNQAIEAFVVSSLSLIEKVSTQEWHNLRSGLASQLLEKDASLRVKSQRFWSSISSKDFKFNNKQKLIDTIRKMELSAIKAFVGKFLTDPASNTIAADHINLISVKNSSQISTCEGTTDLGTTSKKLIKTGKIKY